MTVGSTKGSNAPGYSIFLILFVSGKAEAISDVTTIVLDSMTAIL
jgi:hypothetical protein